jgi:hypothetical protein
MARFEKFTQYHEKVHPRGKKSTPNVGLAGSKMVEVEAANALI